MKINKEIIKTLWFRVATTVLGIVAVVGVGLYLFWLNQPSPISVIPNSSVESAELDPRYPEKWKQGNWGDNQAEFAYVEGGHSGGMALKVEIKKYKDGDAKWFFEELNVLGGETYYFEHYYQSNAETEVIVMMVKNNNEKSFVSLGKVSISNDWNKFSGEIAVPDDVNKISIYHIINKQGYLITDDYYLQLKDAKKDFFSFYTSKV